MRPTFPVRTADLRKQAFTFVEVLVALCIAVIMVSVIGSSLITSLNAEQTAAHLQKSAALVQRVAAASFLGLSPTEVLSEDGADWNMLSESKSTNDGTNSVVWQVWTLSPKAKPALKTVLALRSVQEKAE